MTNYKPVRANRSPDFPDKYDVYYFPGLPGDKMAPVE